MTEQELMLTAVLECERVNLYVDRPALSLEQKARLEDIKARRENGEPLQYILGTCEFMGLTLKVDGRVLIPRPETELLVEAACEKVKLFFPQKTVKILDLGTGSGNIAVSLAKCVESCQITAVDVSPEAIALARENAENLQVAHKIHFVTADMSAYLKEQKARQNTFDLIISNPPYVPTNQLARLPRDVQREPRLALAGGEDGLDFYRAILVQGVACLNSGGFFLFDIGDGQRANLEKVCSSDTQFAKIEFQKDYVQTDRIMVVNKSQNLELRTQN